MLNSHLQGQKGTIVFVVARTHTTITANKFPYSALRPFGAFVQKINHYILIIAEIYLYVMAFFYEHTGSVNPTVQLYDPKTKTIRA